MTRIAATVMVLMQRWLGLAILAAFLVLAEVGCSNGEQKMPNDVPLAALMYLWYGFDLHTGESIGGLGTSHWNTPGVHNAHRRGVTDEPEYGFYASDDPTVIARQLGDMQKAGISVILISYWGSGDSNLDGIKENKESEAMLRAANVLFNYISTYSAPFKVAFLVEPYMSHPSELSLAQKQAILDFLWDSVYNVYPDSMFHWEGKPLLVTWDPVELKISDDPRFTVKTWGSYFGDLDWRTESDQDWNWYPDPEWLPNMISDDGMYVVFPRFDEYWLYIMGREVSYPYRRVDPLFTEGIYEQAWQVAVDNRDKIKLIVLYSWNEHKEHAAIEPDKGISQASYGRSLVKKTSAYYRQFLAGLPITTYDDPWNQNAAPDSPSKRQTVMNSEDRY